MWSLQVEQQVWYLVGVRWVWEQKPQPMWAMRVAQVRAHGPSLDMVGQRGLEAQAIVDGGQRRLFVRPQRLRGHPGGGC